MKMPPPIDVTKLYSLGLLKSWHLPNPTWQEPDGSMVRDLTLDLAEVIKTAGDSPILWICSDILTINADVVLPEESIIIARCIVCPPNAGFILNTDSTVQLTVQQVLDPQGHAVPLKCSRVVDDKVDEYTMLPDQAPDGTLCWSWALGQTPEWSMAVASDPSWMRETEQSRQYIDTLFQIATLLREDQPTTSLHMLKWVARLASTSQYSLRLYAQATALATSIEASGGVQLVPRLDKELYASDTNDWLEHLKWRNEALSKIEAKDDLLELWEGLVSDALSRDNASILLEKKLEQRAEINRKRTLDAYRAAAQSITLQRHELMRAKHHFDTGIVQWRREQTSKAIVNIVTGSLQILEQIPAIVASPEAAVLPLLESGVSIAIKVTTEVDLSGMSSAIKAWDDAGWFDVRRNNSQVDDDADAGDDEEDDSLFGIMFDEEEEEEDYDIDNHLDEIDDKVQQLLDDKQQKVIQEAENKRKNKLDKAKEAAAKGGEKAGKGAEKVADSIMTLISLAKKTEKMQEKSQQALDASNDASTEALSSIATEGLDVVTGGSQVWHEVAIEMDAMFEGIAGGALSSITGGVDYRSQMKILISRGQALSDARVALAQANSALAEQRLRRQHAETLAEIYKTRGDQLMDKHINLESLRSLLFNRVLDAKRSVYMMLDNYRRAYDYFVMPAASDLPALPSMTAPLDSFIMDSREILSRGLAARSLSAEVQPFEQTIVIDDPETIRRFQASGLARFEIPTTHKDFKGLWRVRLKGVRAVVAGLDNDVDVNVDIKTSGYFSDLTNKGKKRNFVAAPLRLGFRYRGEKIILDGARASRFANDYYLPSPFTSWILYVTGSGNQTLDLSNSSAINFQLSGQASLI